MKCLIINASPRSGSIIARMTGLAAEYASESGAETEIIDLYRENFAFCTGCCACRTKNTCTLERDAAHMIGEKICRADLLVIGTPTYWGDMSSKLKALLDRLVYIFAELPVDGFPKPKLKGRKAIIVATCSTPYPFNILFRQSRGAVAAVNEVLKTAGYDTKSIQIAGTARMTSIPERKIESMRRKIEKSIK